MALELDDWGGTGPLLHFACANGFPPETYRKLFARLATRYHVVSLRTRPLIPDEDPKRLTTWRELGDDLARELKVRGRSGVLGVGHSVGGASTLMASAANPGLFRAVVALDPVLITGPRAWAVRLMKLLGRMDRAAIVQGALRRRDRWPSRQEAADAYRERKLFRDWDADCFNDYITHGLVPTPEGDFKLRIPREWEARIFETFPADPWKLIRANAAPTLVLRGEKSDALLPAALARVERELPLAKCDVLPLAAHLFPLEQPRETAERILAFLENLPPEK
ncbi:alpha/beta hydrolase [Corallococcus sp. bb12-1]|uniref:alpha/beta fold hydrolase n=1 Tax=Corallococcus sp. bb12-1 TaxID=2996784 RepID=UPI00226DA83C|nr:alpha/beta hydrolase [Corallococcus sp. bb12-1]MCY1043499.1 alpha/beta hydrolase [Corallococcus sp. bb12-1]